MNRCGVCLLLALLTLASAAEARAQSIAKRLAGAVGPAAAGQLFRPFRPWRPWPRPYPFPYPYPVPYPYPYFVPYPADINPYTPGVQSPGGEQAKTDAPPTDNRARIVIRLPSTVADVWVDDQKMSDRIDSERLYVSPPLEPGHTYAYTVKVRFVRRFENVTEERVVHVRPNETSIVDFAAAPARVSTR
jgi:uncharacterized protein (TIGR03000 family)